MTLLADIGNSALSWLTVAELGAGDTPRHHVYREHGLTPVLDAHWAALPAPAAVHVACVAHSAGEELARWCQQHWGLQPVFAVTSAAAAGVANGYTEPGQLGIDRWAALVGAHSLGAADYCIVDAGTALTVDLLDRRGRHHGGLILPGRHLMQYALAGESEALGAAEATAPSVSIARFPARDTASCIAAGSLAGMAGAVREALRGAPALLGDAPHCLICGGDAPALLDALGEVPARSLVHRPELVLRGVARLAGLAMV